MKVTVLYGGPSAEREVSLVSGKAVIEGLQSMGHEVFGSDVSPEDLSGLDRPADVVFPVLHGQFGESGELQEILEQRKLPFVGSGAAASRLGMNKANTKIAWENAGLPTPKWLYVNADTYEPAAGPEGLFAPCVVKAIDSGSSIDVFICKTIDAARDACAKIVRKHGRALVEQFIKGTELTVGILEEKPLAPIRITTTRDFYDYDAKYKGQTTEYHFDLNLPADVVENVRELARKAHGVVGARDLSRIDVMLDEQHGPYLLEINTLPGFTPRSLLPKAAKQSGIEFGPLVDRLVKRAHARGRTGA
jgi:D-alanine-D-alanine ligase